MDLKKELKEWSNAILHAVFILIILYFVCWPVRIEGVSMEQNFSSGDRVMISKVFLWLNRIDRDDVIVCKMNNFIGEKDIIKRVIGVGGDHIVIKNGEVLRNGEPLEEVYAMGQTWGEIDLIVPENAYFLLGDNREHSLDSRDMGTIAASDIKGKVIFRFFPFNKIGLS